MSSFTLRIIFDLRTFFLWWIQNGIILSNEMSQNRCIHNVTGRVTHCIISTVFESYCFNGTVSYSIERGNGLIPVIY